MPVVTSAEIGLERAEDPAGQGEVAAIDEPTGPVGSGRIFNRETLEGIEGATVRAFPPEGGGESGTIIPADVEGTYRIEGLAEGWWVIQSVNAPGYPGRTSTKKTLVEIVGDELIEGIDFACDPGRRVAGILVSGEGEPVPGVRVHARLEGGIGSEYTKTDPDGTFELRLLGEERRLPKKVQHFIIQAQNEEFESAMLGPLDLPLDGVDDLELRLVAARTGSIAGTIVDPEGQPIQDVGVILERGKSNYLITLGHDKSEKDGAFRIEKLAAGDYGILLTAPGVEGFSSDHEVIRVELDEGEEITDLALVFGMPAAGIIISGRVTDTSGTPLQHVEIGAAGNGHLSTTTD